MKETAKETVKKAVGSPKWYLATGAALALVLTTLSVLPGGSTAEAAPAQAAAQQDKPRLKVNRTYRARTGAQVRVKEWSDSSGTATVTMDRPAKFPAARAVNGCVRQVTVRDVEKYASTPLKPGQPDRGPIGTGACKGSQASMKTAAARRGRGSGIRVPAHRCTGWKHFSGNDVHANLCVTYRVKRRKNGRTTWVARGTASAYNNDGGHGDSRCWDCDHLEKFKTSTNHRHARVVSWAPHQTSYPKSGCHTSTVSVETRGISASRQVEKCEDTFGPNALGDHRSGAKWTGPALKRNHYRSANFINLTSTHRKYDKFVARFTVAWD